MHVISATNSLLFMGGAGGITYFKTTSKQYGVFTWVSCNIPGGRRN